MVCQTAFGQGVTGAPANEPASLSSETPRQDNSSANANLLLAHQPHPGKTGVFQIKYALKIRGEVRLQILDAAGNSLRTLVEEHKERGSYTFEFDPATWFLAPGKYLCRLESNSATLIQPIDW